MVDSRPYAVLFDLDGTLIDSIALLLASMRHTFQGRPRQPTDAEWIEGLGTPLPKQLTPYVESDEDRERLVNRYRVFQHENHDRLMAAYAGVIDTLALLYQRGHPMGVVTSKGNTMMERGLKFIGADDYIEVAIGYDSVHIHKPDPYPVRAALEKLGYESNEAVFVGDSPHDIRSGNEAGVITVAALWGPFRRDQLEPYQPTYFLDNIKQLPSLIDRIATKSAG
ncbi:MAG TPA: HAD-IA family hydrolase [Gemmatimonadaceae bacterium]|jgi:pyrophosphatase PpaX|nr:HAD-IA family hydrolase [Gemmatimonadaceae bacterium]